MAGISHGNIYKVKVILSSGDADIICSVRKGNMSINRAYLRVTEKSAKQRAPKETAPVVRKPPESLLPIGDAIRDLLNRVTEGEATTKMIITELTRVAQMIDEVENGKESI